MIKATLNVVLHPLLWRLLWLASPGIVPCLLFWLSVLCFLIRHASNEPSRETRIPEAISPLSIVVLDVTLFAGLVSNALVTIVNDGYMPVYHSESEGNWSMWAPVTSGGRLTLLGDVIPALGAWWSIGDVLILSGLVLQSLLTLMCRWGFLSTTSIAESKPH